MKPKVEASIYVARGLNSECIIMDLKKMSLNESGQFVSNVCKYYFPHYCIEGIKLKKGEQVRIPIDIDKAEVVK